VTDTSVVFNVIGKESGVGAVLGRVKSLFRSTGSEAAAAMRVADREVEKLDHEINSAKDSLQVLAREFAKASSAAERLNISRQMKRESSNLSQLTKARNLLPDGEAEGQSFGKKLVSGITTALGSGTPGMAMAIGPAALAAAPFIGATISAAVVGAAGIGGVIGGVTIAAKDQRVISAWKSLGDGAKRMFQDAATPFVPAVQRAIESAKGSIGTLEPTIRSVFKNSAGYLDPLVRGVLGMVENVATGFAKANAAAGPVIATISDHLPEIGERIGTLFETAAKHANSGADALNILFTTIEQGIGSLTKVVDLLATMYEWNRKIGGDTGLRLVLGLFGDAPSKIDPATNSASKFQEATELIDKAAKDAETKLNALINAMDEFADSNLSVYEAETRATQATVDATKALKENGETHSRNSEKGRKNRDTIAALARAYNTTTTANDKANVSANKSNASYDRQRASFIKAAQAAGYTAKEANNLADKVLKIPKNRTVTIKGDVKNAKVGIDNVRAALGRIPRVVSIAMRITGTSSVSAAAAAVRKNEARAKGGPVQRDTPYLVGEEGPELVVPQTNGTVLTASMTRGVMGQQSSPAPRSAGGGSILGRGSRVVRVIVDGQDPRLVALVRYLIRTTGLIENAIA